jgi:hypothetical protein
LGLECCLVRYQRRHASLEQETEQLERVLAGPTFPFLFLEQLNAAPDKPQNGMIAWADGTNWNPGGAGQGIYAYHGSAWNKLG